MNLAPYEEEIVSVVADWAFSSHDFTESSVLRPFMEARVSQITRRAVEEITAIAVAAGASAGIARVLKRQLMHCREAARADVKSVVSEIQAADADDPTRPLLSWARRGVLGPLVPTRGQYHYTTYNEDCLGRALNLSRGRRSRGTR